MRRGSINGPQNLNTGVQQLIAQHLTTTNLMSFGLSSTSLKNAASRELKKRKQHLLDTADLLYDAMAECLRTVKSPHAIKIADLMDHFGHRALGNEGAPPGFPLKLPVCAWSRHFDTLLKPLVAAWKKKGVDIAVLFPTRADSRIFIPWDKRSERWDWYYAHEVRDFWGTAGHIVRVPWSKMPSMKIHVRYTGYTFSVEVPICQDIHDSDNNGILRILKEGEDMLDHALFQTIKCDFGGRAYRTYFTFDYIDYLNPTLPPLADRVLGYVRQPSPPEFPLLKKSGGDAQSKADDLLVMQRLFGPLAFVPAYVAMREHFASLRNVRDKMTYTHEKWDGTTITVIYTYSTYSDRTTLHVKEFPSLQTGTNDVNLKRLLTGVRRLFASHNDGPKRQLKKPLLV